MNRGDGMAGWICAMTVKLTAGDLRGDKEGRGKPGEKVNLA